MRQLRPLIPTVAACIALAGAYLGAISTTAQPTASSPFAPPANGPARNESTWLALVGATVHPAPGQTLYRATVVIRDGVITQVLEAQAGDDGVLGTGDDVAPTTPPGPREVDCRGEHIYAGFVEAYCEVGAGPSRGMDSAGAAGLHFNEEVQPQRSALDAPRPEGQLAKLRERGFVAAAIAPNNGIFRGRAAVISTASKGEEASAAKPSLYRENAYHAVALEYRDEDRGYPDSLMGAIAVVRQTLSDADWMASTRQWVEAQRTPPRSASADALARANAMDPGPTNAMDYLARGDEITGVIPARPTHLLFRTDDELDTLRAMKIAREFDRPAMIVGSGREFRRLPALVAALRPATVGHQEDPAQTPLILPLNFPKQPDVSSVASQEGTDVRTMMEWEQSPTNPRRCVDAGLRFALTTYRLRDGDDFIGAVRTAIAHGLHPDVAYGALTTEPAAMLGLESQLGRITPGMRANVVVSDESIFTSAADPRAAAPTLRAVYVDGVRHELSPSPADFSGTWTVDTADGAKMASGLASGLALRITRNGEVTVQSTTSVDAGAGADAAAGDAKPEPKRTSTRAMSVQLTRQTVAFQFDPAKLVEREPGKPKPPAGVVSMTAAVEGDERGAPLRLIGQGVTDEGRRFTWTARKDEPTTPQGVWRAAQAAGLVLPDDAPRQVFITLDDSAASIVIMLEPSGDSKRDANLPRFAALRAEDIRYEDGACTFTIHADAVKKLTEMGFKQPPGDMRVTIKRTSWNTASGEAVTLAPPADPNAPAPAPGDAAAAEAPKAAEALRVGFELESVERAPTEETLKKARALIRRINAIPFELPTPFGPYGVVGAPEAAGLVVFTNATIWTQTEQGILENASLVIENGKIAAVIPAGGTIPAGAKVVDAKGLHITPGIIDCHSHIGISKGVNEGGQAITAEVRIQDVTNPDDINWYRHLASGVTAVNNLHGSANCIGGQSQTNKCRWGCVAPDDMHMEGAPKGIKFALGENPTQVNWGLPRRERYPISRMGIAALIRDRFTQAKAYMADRAVLKENEPQARRDLELDAIAEIIAGERLIHCHAYRQDEMRMLIATMRDFGVRIGTFQHVLEGYKLAEEIRDYTGGGSGFTDWWAYKMEVQDAIPQGLPLMQEVGAVVSFNSDSAEMARRLNVEAAKAIKYSDGRITPQDALAFVTSAPAKQLGVGAHIGAIAQGMDADLAIWNGSPLSAFSRCVSTWVDGHELFSDAKDAMLRETIRGERARLIRKIQGVGEDDPDLDAPAADTTPTGEPARPEGAPKPDGTQATPPTPATPRQMHRELIRRKYLAAYLSGGLTPDLTPGCCGCEE